MDECFVVNQYLPGKSRNGIAANKVDLKHFYKRSNFYDPTIISKLLAFRSKKNKDDYRKLLIGACVSAIGVISFTKV